MVSSPPLITAVLKIVVDVPVAKMSARVDVCELRLLGEVLLHDQSESTPIKTITAFDIVLPKKLTIYFRLNNNEKKVLGFRLINAIR